ncbi:MAG: hypothetical protein ABIR36_12950 [Nitrospiraceae bacterium]
MTNVEKLKRIRPWINPEERVTVHFLDAPDLNTTVTNCTDQLVDLSIETQVSHIKQHISVPLRQIEVSEDSSHYTRDPEQPLQRQRLMLVIDEKRPPIIY